MRAFLQVGLRVLAVAAFAVGLVFGNTILGTVFSPRSAEASRNAGGTYSLPSGNPVVAGTAITATWANTTLSDLGTEMTDSLNRSGKGAMLAPLQLSNGTASLPSLTFGSETASGIYRAGSQDVRMQINTNQIQKWTATGVTLPVGLTAAQTQTNTPAVTATGNGTGPGINGIGGSSSGTGVLGTGGSSDGVGVSGVGTGLGVGVLGTGGAAAAGVSGTGGAGGPGMLATGGASTGPGLTANGTGSGSGVVGTGGTTGKGGVFAAGTAATGSTRSTALEVTNGDINLNGVANSNANVAMLNKLSPGNLIKAWAKIDAGSATPTISDGFNVTSLSCVASPSIRLTLAQAMANTNYAVVATQDLPLGSMSALGLSTTVVEISLYDFAGASVDLCAVAGNTNVSVIVLGYQ